MKRKFMDMKKMCDEEAQGGRKKAREKRKKERKEERERERRRDGRGEGKKRGKFQFAQCLFRKH